MTDQEIITQKCAELYKLLNDRGTPDMTRVHVLLIELRAYSDKPGAIIPLDAFVSMGDELRMACFDMFLGLLAASLNLTLPAKRN